MKFLVKISPSIPPKIAEMDRLPRVGEEILDKYRVISVKPPPARGRNKTMATVTVVLKRRLDRAG